MHVYNGFIVDQVRQRTQICLKNFDFSFTCTTIMPPLQVQHRFVASTTRGRIMSCCRFFFFAWAKWLSFVRLNARFKKYRSDDFKSSKAFARAFSFFISGLSWYLFWSSSSNPMNPSYSLVRVLSQTVCTLMSILHWECIHRSGKYRHSHHLVRTWKTHSCHKRPMYIGVCLSSSSREIIVTWLTISFKKKRKLQLDLSLSISLYLLKFNLNRKTQFIYYQMKIIS